MSDNIKLTLDIRSITDKKSKEDALKIDPKFGTSASFIRNFVISGATAIDKLKADKEPEIKSNSERLSKKYADEANAPIIAELNEGISAVKNKVRTQVNQSIDKRIQQINYSRIIPIRENSWKLLRTIEALINMDADISESDWKLWAEQFAGHHLEERYFATLAGRRNITVLISSDPEKSIERLETLRDMANKTIDHLDDHRNSVVALSFLKSGNSALTKLMDEIDSDMVSIVPAEKITLLQRLKDAKENAYNKDDVALSVKIGSFIDRNMDKLATPEEINENLFQQAEDFITQGMSAKR